MRTTFRFPFGVLLHDERFDGLDGVRSDTGVGSADSRRQYSFIVRYAEDRFLATQRFVELGSHHAFGGFVGKNHHDGRPADGVAHLVGRDTGLDDLQAYIVVAQFAQGLLDRTDVLKLIQFADIGDKENVAFDGGPVELLRVEAVVDRKDRLR